MKPFNDENSFVKKIPRYFLLYFAACVAIFLISMFSWIPINSSPGEHSKKHVFPIQSSDSEKNADNTRVYDFTTDNTSRNKGAEYVPCSLNGEHFQKKDNIENIDNMLSRKISKCKMEFSPEEKGKLLALLKRKDDSEKIKPDTAQVVPESGESEVASTYREKSSSPESSGTQNEDLASSKAECSQNREPKNSMSSQTQNNSEPAPKIIPSPEPALKTTSSPESASYYSSKTEDNTQLKNEPRFCTLAVKAFEFAGINTNGYKANCAIESIKLESKEGPYYSDIKYFVPTPDPFEIASFRDVPVPRKGSYEYGYTIKYLVKYSKGQERYFTKSGYAKTYPNDKSNYKTEVNIMKSWEVPSP